MEEQIKIIDRLEMYMTIDQKLTWFKRTVTCVWSMATRGKKWPGPCLAQEQAILSLLKSLNQLQTNSVTPHIRSSTRLHRDRKAPFLIDI